MSPDGSKLVYGLKTQSGSDLYLKDLQTSSQDKKLTSHPATESDVIWTKDNKSILFLANRAQSSQVWQLKLDGGEAQALTDLDLNVNGYKLSPDNKKLVQGSVEGFSNQLIIKGTNQFCCILGIKIIIKKSLIAKPV